MFWSAHGTRINMTSLFLLLTVTLDTGTGRRHGNRRRHRHRQSDVTALQPGVQLMQCEQAQMMCFQRAGCQMSLTNYHIHCGRLITGEIHHCAPRCKKALASLLSTDDRVGEKLVSCDCGGNTHCLTQKRRMGVCSQAVISTMRHINDDRSALSCTLAYMLCTSDTSCFTALGFYKARCDKMFRGVRCNSRCRNSIDILYRQTKARKLRNCRCDGTEDFDCETIQSNTERLCFAPRRKHRPRPVTSPATTALATYRPRHHVTSSPATPARVRHPTTPREKGDAGVPDVGGDDLPGSDPWGQQGLPGRAVSLQSGVLSVSCVVIGRAAVAIYHVVY